MISTLRLNPLPYFNVFRLRWIRQPENVFAINHAPKGSLKKRNKPFSGCLCTHLILCQRRRFVAYHEQGRGCLYWVCEADFVSESRLCKVQTAARLNTLRGLATQQRLFYVYGAKSAATPNIKYKQPRSPCTPRGDGFRLPTLAPAFRQPETPAL